MTPERIDVIAERLCQARLACSLDETTEWNRGVFRTWAMTELRVAAAGDGGRDG